MIEKLSSSERNSNSPELLAYRVDKWPLMPIVPSPLVRSWMDPSNKPHAYRCLPMVIANQSGWLILNTHTFRVTWNGGDGPSDIQFEYLEGDEPYPANSIFGYGVITWHLPYLFRTPPGYNMHARGPANWPKDGVYALEGIVETDWSVAPFTFNWKLTRPNHQVTFQRGEPFCMIVPQRRGELDAFEPRILDIETNPEAQRGHRAWRESRTHFVVRKKVRNTRKAGTGWQGDYLRGVTPTGQNAAEHETRLNLREFINDTEAEYPAHSGIVLGPDPSKGKVMEQSTGKVTPGWRTWIAENKMIGVSDREIIDTLTRQGLNASEAISEVAAAAPHPYVQAGTLFARRLAKIESLLFIHHNLAAQSVEHTVIERRSAVSHDEFRERYYSANRPVILTDIMNDWNALSRWTPEYLKQTCGDETVEVMVGRESNPDYEAECEKHRKTMLMREYVDMIISGGDSNDYYLVANNGLLERDNMQGLFDDIEIFPEYLDPDKRAGAVFFWFGPAGTVTPLHHDTSNILIAQVIGRKRIILISADQLPLLYNYTGVFSLVDWEKPDLDRYPLFRHVCAQEIVLEPGEVLFIPVGWWHHVRSLDTSISVSFTNFLYSNTYNWNHP